MRSQNLEKKWLYLIFISSLACIFLLATSFRGNLVSSLRTINIMFSIFPPNYQTSPLFAEAKVKHTPSSSPSASSVPRFAYLISGSKGEIDKLWRTLQTLYHPWNQYVVHLDLESQAAERLELASRLERDPIFSKVGNVHMIKKANMVTYRGPTMVTNTLHACAILLKKSKDWDWFINLSASDYPLVTQDDLLYTFSELDRELNFIEHTSQLGWKEHERAMPLIIDPGLYRSQKSDIRWVTPRRTLPTAFRLFTGSAWTILSHAFVEYCVWGWDNVPRMLLMYYANYVSSPEAYFQTLICNVPEFTHTVINHDLHYIVWDAPPKQHPHTLSINDTNEMIASAAAFARKFKQDDPVLDKIDNELLGRTNGSLTPGGWCSGNPPCSKVGNPTRLKPGPGARRLGRLLDILALAAKLRLNQCH